MINNQRFCLVFNSIFLVIFLTILMLAVQGCSTTTKKNTTERTKLTITEKQEEKKTEVECFCPENKKEGTANVITAVGGVLSSLVGAIF